MATVHAPTLSVGKNKLNQIKGNAGLYVMLLPAVILVLLFAYRPMYGVLMAFQDYRHGPIWGAPWADPWYRHFYRFFNSPSFFNILRNTLVISGYNLIAGFPFPIIVAVCLNHIRRERFKRFYQTVSYMPHFISTVVMVALILVWLDPESGLWGNFFRLIFGEQAQVPNLMASSALFPHIYVWSEVWQRTGWNSIIFFAALSSIDPALYEAATVDGASRWQKIMKIDIPMILPTASILLILSAGGIMNLGFEKAFLMQNNLNISSSEIIATYIYRVGLTGTVPQFSFSTAVNLFNNVINLILLLSVNWVSKRLGNTSLW